MTEDCILCSSHPLHLPERVKGSVWNIKKLCSQQITVVQRTGSMSTEPHIARPTFLFDPAQRILSELYCSGTWLNLKRFFFAWSGNFSWLGIEDVGWWWKVIHFENTYLEGGRGVKMCIFLHVLNKEIF